MFSAIYVEQQIKDHPRSQKILSRFASLPVITIERYGEIFNRKGQNFRLQKQHPALILAEKHERLVMPAPAGYGLGGKHNYYFSHMLNCIYDCRYCFLQGMYRSAHYLLFVNYEDFIADISSTIERHNGETSYFYSGYDCDSLALEPITAFVDCFLPLFDERPQSVLELRTKSTQIRVLLDRPPLHNVVVAFSFTPDNISQQLEHKVPALHKRVEAVRKLQQRGWKVGLRFDPLIYEDRFADHYRQLFDTIFSQIEGSQLHSVSLGVFRLPETFYRNMQKLYPNEKLFAARLTRRDGMASYSRELESAMVSECQSQLLNYIPDHIYFPCSLEF
jgi:spore photoproduct lyase